MPDNRRESDRVLPLILQRLDRQDKLSDEWRAKADSNHAAMLTKLESLPVMAITQASHGLRLDKVEPKVEALEDLMQREVLPLLGGLRNTTPDSQNALTISARFKNWKWPLAVVGGTGAGAGIMAWAKGLLAGLAGIAPHP